MTRLKTLRETTHDTQETISKLIGITRGAYANIENGKREADFRTLNILADYFSVTVDYLIGRDEQKEKPTLVSESGPVDQLTVRLNELLGQANPSTKKAMIALLEQLQTNE